MLLLLGIGQRTFLAGPSEIVVPITAEGGEQYALIDGEEFSKVGGQANIVMRGSSSVAVIANTRDAEGWLEPFAHIDVTVDPDTHATTTEFVPAVPSENEALDVDEDGNAVPLDLRGSDLWLETSTGEDGPIRLPVAPKSDQSIIISGDGEDGIPSGSAIVWVQDRNTPFAGPLLAAGGAFALLGAVLYLLAFDRDRRALGPRRGRRGPLLGVRNVVGSRRRKTHAPEPKDSEPKRGVLSTAPALPRGTSEGDAQTSETEHTTEQGEGHDAVK